MDPDEYLVFRRYVAFHKSDVDILVDHIRVCNGGKIAAVLRRHIYSGDPLHKALGPHPVLNEVLDCDDLQ